MWIVTATRLLFLEKTRMAMNWVKLIRQGNGTVVYVNLDQVVHIAPSEYDNGRGQGSKLHTTMLSKDGLPVTIDVKEPPDEICISAHDPHAPPAVGAKFV
jgi:hypothetical protein